MTFVETCELSPRTSRSLVPDQRAVGRLAGRLIALCAPTNGFLGALTMVGWLALIGWDGRDLDRSEISACAQRDTHGCSMTRRGKDGSRIVPHVTPRKTPS